MKICFIEKIIQVDIVDRYVLTIVFSWRKELYNKQKTTDILLNIINYMDRNSNEPGKHFYKTYECSVCLD